MSGLNLVMPMGGGGTRFLNNGYECPKPMIDLCGKPFFYYAAKSISDYVNLSSITFVVLKEHIQRFHIDDEIRRYFKDAGIEVIDKVLPGAVLTCMNGVKHLNDEPVIFNDCDHSFVCSAFYKFCENGFLCENGVKPDGALLTFESDEDKFSYAAFDESGFVTKTVEKEVISSDAICGAYYFKNKDIFMECAEEYLKNCGYKEFFMSGVYNVMADKGLKITAFRTDEHISFGTPSEYEEAVEIYKSRM